MGCESQLAAQLYKHFPINRLNYVVHQQVCACMIALLYV